MSAVSGFTIDQERLPVLSDLRERIEGIADKQGLDLVVVFGSRASGRGRPDSDVDLAIGAASPLEFRRLLDVTGDLQEVFGGIRADVSDLRRADPLFLRKIFESGVCIFERPGQFEDARLRALHRYEDYRPFLKLERDCVRRALGLR